MPWWGYCTVQTGSGVRKFSKCYIYIRYFRTGYLLKVSSALLYRICCQIIHLSSNVNMFLCLPKPFPKKIIFPHIQWSQQNVELLEMTALRRCMNNCIFKVDITENAEIVDTCTTKKKLEGCREKPFRQYELVIIKILALFWHFSE